LFQSSGTEQISAGGEHTFVVTKDGQLFAWGEGNHGQLAAAGAHSERAQGEESKAVAVALEQPARQVECGVHHTLAVGQDGEVYVWGDFSSSADHSDPEKIGVVACDASWPSAHDNAAPAPNPPVRVDSTTVPVPAAPVVEVEIRETEASYLKYVIRELRKNMLPQDAEWVIDKLQNMPLPGSRSGSPRGSPRNTSGHITSGGSHSITRLSAMATVPRQAGNKDFEALLVKLEEAEGQVQLVTSHLQTVVNEQ
jgi:hypothetical protein